MRTDLKSGISNQFYLVSIDLLKGIAIFPMVLGHAVQWYYRTLAIRYEESSLAVFVIISTGLVVFPGFLFIYGFNLVNSFLHRGRDPSSHHNIRIRTIKRSLIFLVLATIGQVLMSFIRSSGRPETMINYILTWHLFHVFSFTTIALLLIWQLAWILEKSNLKWNLNYLQSLRILLSINLIFILLMFAIFHNYTLMREKSYPVPLVPFEILERAIFDIGTYGLIPWFSFSLSGGLVASLLNLPDRGTQKIKIIDISLILIGFALCIQGLMFLTRERFVSPALTEPSSFPHVFFSIGVLILLTTLSIILLDLYQIYHNIVTKVSYPIIVVSNISLTVYLFHPMFSILDPSVIPSEFFLLLLAILYSLFFVIIAHFWQIWEFKYSLEWFIRKYS